jgi:hypothetical protein
MYKNCVPWNGNTEVLQVQCSTKRAAQVLLQHLAHEPVQRISTTAACFALLEQKRAAQTGFLGVCAARCLHTYLVPENRRAGQVSPLDSLIPSKDWAHQQSQDGSFLANDHQKYIKSRHHDDDEQPSTWQPMF